MFVWHRALLIKLCFMDQLPVVKYRFQGPPFIEADEVLGWPKSLFSFSHQRKDTFFIFTNNLIDFNILSMLAISHVV